MGTFFQPRLGEELLIEQLGPMQSTMYIILTESVYRVRVHSRCREHQQQQIREVIYSPALASRARPTRPTSNNESVRILASMREAAANKSSGGGGPKSCVVIADEVEAGEGERYRFTKAEVVKLIRALLDIC